MKTRLSIAGGVLLLLLAGVAAYLAQSARQQKLEAQFADLRRQMTQPAPATSPAPPEALPVLPRVPTTATATLLQQQRDARILLDESARLLADNQPESARRAVLLLREGIENSDPRNPQLQERLGRALLSLRQGAAARDAFRQGIALAPRDPRLHSGLGWACWQMQDYYHAQHAWETALALDPMLVDAWSAMAWVYLALGDVERSKQGFLLLMSKDKNNQSWLQGLSMAKARNTRREHINLFFPVPPREAFAAPPATSSGPATLR